MQLIPQYTVSELVDSIRVILEGALYYLRVAGEVSNLKLSSNGHSYFSLKDSNAVVNVVFFKNSPTNLKFALADGLSLVVQGRLTIYGERSVYQIIAESMEINGTGSLLRLIEDRKNKLRAEGLFDRKRPIPKNLRKVGLITAKNGAAIRDIEICLADRLPLDEVILYHSSVQGQDAVEDIVRGIRHFNEKEFVDVIVITRGGGSVEDLMCFNSEPLAREIFKSETPLITAIGHEIDWTIADFVSDLRLPTPTAVASFLSPLKKDFEIKFDLLFRKILRNALLLFDEAEQMIDSTRSKIMYLIGSGLRNKFLLFDSLSCRLAAFSRAKIFRQGYALVRKNDKIVTVETNLRPGDLLEIEILDKKFSAVVL
ncbi:MAG: exodeoxyribonuclease VII large subunit [Rickettsiales bacterium]|jgi:exodeoxyribonuclease VII large subunit|nr:exodeoxyribonuclease VII large subunit [Rickettsiales bacterium]